MCAFGADLAFPRVITEGLAVFLIDFSVNGKIPFGHSSRSLIAVTRCGHSLRSLVDPPSITSLHPFADRKAMYGYRKLSLSALLAATLSMLAAPAPAAADKTPVLGIVAIDLQNSFFVRMRQAGDEAAKDYGVKTIWQGSEGSLEKQVSNIENFVNQGVDIILVDPLDSAAIASTVLNANAL